MTLPTRNLPRQGLAWLEGWQERLDLLVHERGFGSVTAYVESRPGATLVELAIDLGRGGIEVAPVQIQWRWVAEAEASGTLERCARGLLARALRDTLPEGWRTEWQDAPGDPTPLSRKVDAFADLVTAMPQVYRAVARRTCVALDSANIVEGWLPANADDPLIMDIFRRYWTDPSVGDSM